jgi:DNA-binding NtrC family response regulator
MVAATRMSRDVLDLFHTYPWPGNVRQLEHCVQHMVAVNSGPRTASARFAHCASEPSAPAGARTRRNGRTPSGPRTDSCPELHFPVRSAAGRSGEASHRGSATIYERRSHDGREPASDRPYHSLPQAQGLRTRPPAACSTRTYNEACLSRSTQPMP